MSEKELIKEAALYTLRVEREALEALEKSIDTVFINCVQKIYYSGGRVVVTGIGKSAIVAQKIVATLNSTGTPALFMHAADAIHGDLGMILPNDIVICLSKSGNTPEIKVLVPLVKTLGSALVGIVANTDSYLAQQADYTLLTPIEKEADYNNLAPTTSTTAQMVMGDALAVALLRLKGFSPKDFAKFHPGGALGKQLYLCVKDLLIQHLVPKVYLEDSLSTVIDEITTKRLGATAVVDTNEQLCGIITDGDLRRMMREKFDFEGIKAKDILHKAPKTIEAAALAVNALEEMRKHNISQLVVVNEKQQYVGMVHLHDLIKEGLV